jgi:hypothetical protein
MTVEIEERRRPRVARVPVAGAAAFREPFAEEVAVLRFLSEQNAATVSQVARFAGAYVSDMLRFLEEMEEQGWLLVRSLVKGDSPWVWLRGKGAELSGTGFGARRPTLRTIAHWAAITEARLYLQEHAPDGVWICERKLRRRRYRGKGRARRKVKPDNRAHIPDALFKVEGEVHAIEAELSRKSEGQLEAIVAQHSARYDAVVYFCAPVTFTDFKQRRLEERYPRLFTCCLVENHRNIGKEEFRDPADERTGGVGRKRDPEEWEVALIDLLNEQGGIPDDQWPRFLRCSKVQAEKLAAHLLEAGFVKRAQPEEEGSGWLFLGTRGARFSTVDAAAQLPTLGGLPLLRAQNEVRLQILEREEGELEWTSGRVLRRERGKEGSLPYAVAVERVGSDRRRVSYAIDVRLNLIDDLDKLYARYRLRAEEHDWVVWYCAPQARSLARKLKEEMDCKRLVVRTIPGCRPPRGARKGRKGKAKAQPRFRRLPAREVEPEVLEVVALAAGGEGEIAVSLVEIREDSVGREYRVSTDDGRWCVRLTPTSWKAQEILD